MNGKGYNLATPGNYRRVRAESHYANRTDEVADLRVRLVEQTALAGTLARALVDSKLALSMAASCWACAETQTAADKAELLRIFRIVDGALAPDAARVALLQGKQQELLIKTLQATVDAYEHVYITHFSTGAVADLQDRLDAIDAEYVAAVAALAVVREERC